MAKTSPIRFVDELPDCCTGHPLRLTPPSVFLEVSSEAGRSSHWDLGLETWVLRIGVSWEDAIDDLAEALSEHLGRPIADHSELERVAAAHGVYVADDDDLETCVGEQIVIKAKFHDSYAEPSGRDRIVDGASLLEAADAAAHDLLDVVAAITDLSDDAPFWCTPELAEVLPGSEGAGAVLILQSVWVTPVLRGNALGAWAGAQGVAILSDLNTVVALKAAPLERRDAVPGEQPAFPPELTPEQSAHWHAEQDRLADHWRTRLGFEPLPSDPTVLVHNTDFVNQKLLNVLALHAP